MDEKKDVNIKDYLVDLNSFPIPKLKMDELIGREWISSILLGALPSFSEQNIVLNFPELTRSSVPGEVTKSIAFLFSGEYGNGKDTLNKAFINKILDIYEDELIAENDPETNISDVLEYYEIRSQKLNKESIDKTCETIEALFQSLNEKIQNDIEDLTIRYISLGDVTCFLAEDEIAQVLTDQIDCILESSKGICIFVGTFRGDSREIPVCAQKSFIISHLDYPNLSMRMKYFEKILKNYPNIKMNGGSSKLAMDTEGFTFGMMEQMTKMILFLVKGKIFNDGLELEKYILPYKGQDIQPIDIGQEEINSVISDVKHSSLLFLRENTTVLQNSVVVSNVNAEKNAMDDKNILEKRKMNFDLKIEDIEMPDTFEEIEAYKERLLIIY